MSNSDAYLVKEILAPLFAHFASCCDSDGRLEAFLDGAALVGFADYPIELAGLNPRTRDEIIYACGWLDAYAVGRDLELREVYRAAETTLAALGERISPL